MNEEAEVGQLALLIICPECFAARGMACLETDAPHDLRTAPVRVAFEVGKAWGHRGARVARKERQ